jgi:glycerol-3-phosphate acyltransferase PlsY
VTSTLFSILAGYLIGSIPFALVLARRMAGIDLRGAGSGNVGAANVFRTTGLLVALTTVMLDVSKGAGAVLLAQAVSDSPAAVSAAGLAAILGHVYSIWIRFRGGKGVATSCGVFAVLAPEATLVSLALFVLTVVYSRYISLGSLVASVALPIAVHFTRAPIPTLAGAIAAAAIVIERHRPNLVRLHAGTERRIGQRA